MKIQVWSDFRCPFCYIGKKNLESAIAELDGDYEIEMMSYELDPNFVPNGRPQVEGLAEKYGISLTEAQQNLDRVIDMAKGVGLNYDFNALIDVNTVNAHKVFQYAKLKNLGNEFAEVTLSAYFEKGTNIDDVDALVTLGATVGLDETGIRSAYESDDYLLKVRQDEQWAQMANVRGVPHFVIDNTVSLSGAQPKETFKDAIAYTIDYVAKMNKENEAQGSDDLSCTDEGCKI